MRGVQIAVLLLCIHIAGFIVTTTGVFAGIFYERKLITGFNTSSEVSAMSSAEQTLAAIGFLNNLRNILAWGWITSYFEPAYSNIYVVKATVDALTYGLTILSWALWLIVFIQFLRNLIQPL